MAARTLPLPLTLHHPAVDREVAGAAEAHAIGALLRDARDGHSGRALTGQRGTQVVGLEGRAGREGKGGGRVAGSALEGTWRK